MIKLGYQSLALTLTLLGNKSHSLFYFQNKAHAIIMGLSKKVGRRVFNFSITLVRPQLKQN
jgi:hypothetical protein